MSTQAQHSPSAPVALECFAANLRRAERAVYRLYAGELREVGIEPTQYTVLKVIQRRPEILQTDLAHFLAVDPTTLTRNLRVLRERGLLERQPGADRRTRPLRLTDEGEALLKQALPHWERAQARLRQSLEGESWESTIARILDITAAAEHA